MLGVFLVRAYTHAAGRKASCKNELHSFLHNRRNILNHYFSCCYESKHHTLKYFILRCGCGAHFDSLHARFEESHAHVDTSQEHLRQDLVLLGATLHRSNDDRMVAFVLLLRSEVIPLEMKCQVSFSLN